MLSLEDSSQEQSGAIISRLQRPCALEPANMHRKKIEYRKKLRFVCKIFGIVLKTSLNFCDFLEKLFNNNKNQY